MEPSLAAVLQRAFCSALHAALRSPRAAAAAICAQETRMSDNVSDSSRPADVSAAAGNAAGTCRRRTS